jgi:hypothetical protein
MLFRSNDPHAVKIMITVLSVFCSICLALATTNYFLAGNVGFGLFCVVMAIIFARSSLANVRRLRRGQHA